MITNWKNEFAPHILTRGKKYFEEGRIGKIQRDGTAYIATVEGTKDYEVEIVLAEETVEEMTCSCPYAENGTPCKHMAAMLFALAQKDTVIEDLPPTKLPPMVSAVPMKMPWLDAIDNLPEAVVRKELQKQADRDDRLKERLALLYLGKLPEHQMQNWKAGLWKLAKGYTDRRGRIPEENAWDFYNDLDNFQDGKLPLLFEVGALLDAFHVVWIVMETALEWEVDNSDCDAEILFESCQENLQSLFYLATEEQREQMLKWYHENRNEEWLGDISLMDTVFRSLGESPDSMRRGRILQYLGDTPYYLCEGEWVAFPMRAGLYYDFIENTTLYKEAEPILEELLKERPGNLYDCFGTCHMYWNQKKQLLLEKYGIEWFTPSELNRRVIFD